MNYQINLIAANLQTTYFITYVFFSGLLLWSVIMTKRKELAVKSSLEPLVIFRVNEYGCVGDNIDF